MTMPAGTYYIGDLCYVFDDVEWKEICSIMFNTTNPSGVRDGEFEMKQRYFKTNLLVQNRSGYDLLKDRYIISKIRSPLCDSTLWFYNMAKFKSG